MNFICYLQASPLCKLLQQLLTIAMAFCSPQGLIPSSIPTRPFFVFLNTPKLYWQPASPMAQGLLVILAHTQLCILVLTSFRTLRWIKLIKKNRNIEISYFSSCHGGNLHKYQKKRIEFFSPKSGCLETSSLCRFHYIRQRSIQHRKLNFGYNSPKQIQNSYSESKAALTLH